LSNGIWFCPAAPFEGGHIGPLLPRLRGAKGRYNGDGVDVYGKGATYTQVAGPSNPPYSFKYSTVQHEHWKAREEECQWVEKVLGKT
jgi:hypothetical protein